jgi:superoxide reductase
LHPGDAPHAKFALTEDEKPTVVYEYCNLHGLWKAEF